MGKILKTVFQKNEPINTNVLWIKPQGTFNKIYVFNNDLWELVGSYNDTLNYNIMETEEDGFYLVDNNLYIGYYVTPTSTNFGGMNYINYKTI